MEDSNPFGPSYSHEFDPFAFVVLADAHLLGGRLVVDGAASNSCLNQLGRRHIIEGTLRNIDPITLRGTKAVVVTQKADASWPVLNPATQEDSVIHMKDCMILDGLPCSLLSQPNLLKKGCSMDTETKFPDTPQYEVTQTFSLRGVHVVTAEADISTSGLLVVMEPQPLVFESRLPPTNSNLGAYFTNIIALVEFLYGGEEGSQLQAVPKFEERPPTVGSHGTTMFDSVICSSKHFQGSSSANCFSKQSLPTNKQNENVQAHSHSETNSCVVSDNPPQIQAWHLPDYNLTLDRHSNP